MYSPSLIFFHVKREKSNMKAVKSSRRNID